MHILDIAIVKKIQFQKNYNSMIEKDFMRWLQASDLTYNGFPPRWDVKPFQVICLYVKHAFQIIFKVL